MLKHGNVAETMSFIGTILAGQTESRRKCFGTGKKILCPQKRKKKLPKDVKNGKKIFFFYFGIKVK